MTDTDKMTYIWVSLDVLVEFGSIDITPGREVWCLCSDHGDEEGDDDADSETEIDSDEDNSGPGRNPDYL